MEGKIVGLVKFHLKRTVGRPILNWEILNTLTIEIESIVNNKLISFMSDRLSESIILKPVNFLLQISNDKQLSFNLDDDNDKEYIP